MEGEQKVLYTAVMLGIWTLAYAFVHWSVDLPRMSLNKANDIKNRIISMVHGALAFWLCCITLLIKPNVLQRSNNNSTANIIFMISLSYFIYDTLACIHYHLIDRSLLLHHFICICGFLMGLLGFKGIYYMIVGLAVAEISNFPMHLRVIIRNIGYKYTKLYEQAENLYIFLYIVARGIFSPFFLMIPCLMSPKIHILLKLAILALHLQSFFFIYEMIAIIQKKNKRKEEMLQKQIEMDWFTMDQSKLSQLSFYKRPTPEKDD